VDGVAPDQRRDSFHRARKGARRGRRGSLGQIYQTGRLLHGPVPPSQRGRLLQVHCFASRRQLSHGIQFWNFSTALAHVCDHRVSLLH